MAEGNISTIYLGGEDSHDAVPSVLKSTDGGVTWNETFQYVNNANIATNQNGYKGSDYPYAWVAMLTHFRSARMTSTLSPSAISVPPT